MGIEKEKKPNVEDVAEYALNLNDRKIVAFTLQREACEEQIKALVLQTKSWDGILQWVSSLPLLGSKMPTLRELHRGLNMKIEAESKFISGMAMRLDAELEEFRVVQEGIRGQIEQMKAGRERPESHILRPERKGDAIDHERSRQMTGRN